MTEPRVETQRASDGYADPRRGLAGAGRAPRAGSSSSTASRVTAAGITAWAGPWPRPVTRPISPTAAARARTGADRGHTPSPRRLIDDVAERLRVAPRGRPGVADRPGRDQLGRQDGARHRGRAPGARRRPRPDLPRPSAARRGLARRAAADRPGVLHEPPQDVPDPAERPRAVHREPRRPAVHRLRPASACTPATAGLLAASTFIDRRVRRVPPRVRQPVLLMLAGQDRIVDNAKTLAYFRRLASADQAGDRVPRGPPHPGIRARPDAVRPRPRRLARPARPRERGRRAGCRSGH